MFHRLMDIPDRRTMIRLAWMAGLPCLLLFWVYLPMLTGVASSWHNDSRYSHGYLVPLFSLYLLWSRRALLTDSTGSSWWGLLMLLVGLGINGLGTFLFLDWFN